MQGSLAPGRAIVSFLAIAGFLACASVAMGQARPFPYPGTQPVKRPAGDVSWGGSGWIVPPGGVIEWSISVVHDHPSLSTVWTYIADNIPDPASGSPVAAFVLATDVLESPPLGTLSYDGDTLNMDGAESPLGSGYTFRFKNTVLTSATPGTVICNRAWITYVGPEDEGNPVGVPARYTSRTWNDAGLDAPTCVTVATGANLAESTKTVSDADGDGLIEAGETITFTITVRNTGSADATALDVTDTLAPAFTILSAGQGGVIAGQQVHWTSASTPALSRVRAGNSTVLTISATTSCPTTFSLCNRAFITSAEVTTAVGTDDPATTSPGDATCLATARPILSRSPLRVIDASGDGTFDAGESLTYTLTVTNTGNAPATDVQVTLPVPTNLVGVIPRDGGSLAAGVITWTSAGTPGLVSLAPGGSTSVSFDATVDPAAADGATGCATASLTPAGCSTGLSDDPALPGVADATCFLIASRPTLAYELQAIASGGDGVGEPGETIDYVLTLRHLSGAAATDASVRVDLPAVTLLDSLAADDGGLVSGQSITWLSASTPSLASIGAGDVVLLTARGVIPCSAADGASACASGTLDAANLAAVVASDDPSQPGAADPSCFAVNAAILTSTLTATEANSNGVFEAGENAMLTLSIVNAGSATARDLIVTLPLTAADLSVVASDGGRITPSSITWDVSTTPGLATLAPLGSLTLTASLRIDPASAGGRTCHQSSTSWVALASCAPELSADPSIGGASSPTCWNVLGSGLPPGEVPDGDPLSAGPIPVRLSCQGADLLITWDAAPGATLHHVYRGAISSFRTRPWDDPAASISDPENSRPSCDLDSLSYVDESECATEGVSHYFLVQGKNLVGVGPLGESATNAGATERPPVTGPCP